MELKAVLSVDYLSLIIILSKNILLKLSKLINYSSHQQGVSESGFRIREISNPGSGIRISSVSGKRIVTDFTTLSIHFSNFPKYISNMSLSYTGFIRICAYMINNSYYRAQMGPSKKPYSGEVTQAYEKQYKETCFESDGSQCVYFLNSLPNNSLVPITE